MKSQIHDQGVQFHDRQIGKFVTQQYVHIHDGDNKISWRRKFRFMTEKYWLHVVVQWFMTGKFFITRIWIHDSQKKFMTRNNDVSWRIWEFMTWKFFSWPKFQHFMTLNWIHDGRRVDFPDEQVDGLVRLTRHAKHPYQTHPKPPNRPPWLHLTTSPDTQP